MGSYLFNLVIGRFGEIIHEKWSKYKYEIIAILWSVLILAVVGLINGISSLGHIDLPQEEI